MSQKSSVEKGLGVLLGLDNAGKTTLLYNLRWGDTGSSIIPTDGFNAHEFALSDSGASSSSSSPAKLKLWDVGGRKNFRSFWKRYFENINFLFWLVNASEPERLDELAAEYQTSMAELRGASFAYSPDLRVSFIITHVDKLAPAELTTFRSQLEKALSFDQLRSSLGEDHVNMFELNAKDRQHDGFGKLVPWILSSYHGKQVKTSSGGEGANNSDGNDHDAVQK